MGTFFMDEARVKLPDGFIDTTTNTLEWRGQDGGRVALVIQRDVSKGRPSLDELFEMAVAEYKKRLPMLTLEEPPTLELEHRFRATALRWKREQEVVYQVQLYVALSDRTLVVTGSGLAGSRADVDTVMQDFARTLIERVD